MVRTATIKQPVIHTDTTAAVLDRCIRVSFYALIFFLPISIALVSIWAGFAILFFLAKRVRGALRSKSRGFKLFAEIFFPAPGPLNSMLAAYVAAVALSVVFSQYHQLSFLGFFGKLLRGVFLYSAFVEVFTVDKHLRTFVLVWTASAFLAALSGLCQFFYGHDFLRQTPLTNGRVASSLRHANDFGAYIVSICPLLLAFLINCKASFFERVAPGGRSRRLAMALLVCVAALTLMWCLGLTMSRGAWVGFFMGVVLIGVWRKAFLPLVALLIAGFIMLFSPVMLQTRNANLFGDNIVDKTAFQAEEALRTSKTGHLPSRTIAGFIPKTVLDLGSGRKAFWTEAWHIFKAYPVWGSGINTYSQMGQRYKIDWGGYPHNSYLQMAAEVGILGMLTYFLFLGAWIKLALARIRVSTGFGRGLLIGILGSVIAYLTQSFFDTTFFSVQLSVLFWLMLGVGVAAGQAKPTSN